MSETVVVDTTYVILNPRSGGGRAGRNRFALSKAIRRAFPEDRIRLELTTGPGDATHITRRALEHGAGRIVSVGGDGANNEVINGFFADAEGTLINPDAVFVPFPGGRGGDFLRMLRLPRDPDAAAEQLTGVNARVERMDVGRLTCVGVDGDPVTRYFLNITSAGVGGLVDRYVNTMRAPVPAKLQYYLASIRGMFAYTNQPVRITVDGEPPREETIFYIAVANGQYFGSGMWVAPDASPRDGVLDVVIAGDITRRELFMQGNAIYTGAHLDSPKYSHMRAQTVAIEPLGDENLYIDMDGETPGKAPAHIKILSNVLPVHIGDWDDLDRAERARRSENRLSKQTLGTGEFQARK